MGGGRWSAASYTTRAADKAAAGKSTFDYSDTMRSTMPRDSWKVHETLDPKATNQNGAHAGQNVRESYDNTDHPESVPIAVFFDVTGSMGHIPEILQQKLPSLRTLLDDKGYCPDAQLLFGAIGDATCDRVPLQVSQFEADNRSDEHLENILIEGGGGGQVTESYELAMYFMAHLTDTDHFNKRQKKGYLFLMGDEQPYDMVKKDEVKQFIGDDIPESISTKEIAKKLQEKWEVFFYYVEEGSYSESLILPPWKELFGDRALVLPRSDLVAETIACTIGLAEGNVTADQCKVDLAHNGSDSDAIEKAAGLSAKAVATV